MKPGDAKQQGTAGTAAAAAAAGAAARSVPADDSKTTIIRRPTPEPGAQGKTPQPQDAPPDDGGDDKTMVMRVPPVAPPDTEGAGDKTVSIPRVDPANAPTMAMPIQVPPDQQATQRIKTGQQGTDRVTGPRQGPLSKPPVTPRPAPGPRQPGPQGGRPPYEDVEDTRPAPPRPPGRPVPPVPKAPSPADMQMTSPVQSTNSPQGGARTAPPRPIAAPQRIAPHAQPTAEQAGAAEGGRSRRWLLAVAGAAVVLIAILVAVGFTLVGKTSTSPETEVRAAISQYTDALRSGDLSTLQSSTCGPLHDFYAKIPADQFASVHKSSVDRKTIPVVDSVDAIAITGNTAIAQATVFTEADPAKRSARTFDLQHTDAGWKVCDPTGTAS